MYEAFYGLQAKPFQLNPDPRFFYRSTGHQRAMAYLRYGLQLGQGFIVVTGDVGTGKTMLVNTLFKEIAGKGIAAAKIVSTNLQEHDLLQLIASAFDLPFEGQSKAQLLKNLELFFRASMEEGRRVLLVVDEAQNLPRSSLEELRMLSNFDHNGQPLAQSFLLGQREFRSTMRSPGLEQLRQRVIAAYHLRPLNDVETRDYVTHRLQTVGWHSDPKIHDDVYAGVHAFTRGVPRRINTLMDRLLLNCFLDERHEIDPDLLANVVTEIELERGEADDDHSGDEEPAETPPRRPAAAITGAAAAAPVAPGDSVELGKLEQRLGAMQRAVDSISRRLELRIDETAPSYRQPPPSAMPGPALQGSKQMLWLAVLLAGVAVLSICATAAFFLLRS
ncbi:MAG: AAA family ATPase [Gammaproteobacteria bacterium]|nr:AAA family ATPase [Gammaproteobacteria bacterium]